MPIKVCLFAGKSRDVDVLARVRIFKIFTDFAVVSRPKRPTAGLVGLFVAMVWALLYVALHTNEVKRSTDGGRTWVVRVAP